MTCSSPLYLFVGGSTPMGMSLSVLPLRDVVARAGLERVPSLRFAVWLAPLSWLTGAVGLCVGYSVLIEYDCLVDSFYFISPSSRDAPFTT